MPKVLSRLRVDEVSCVTKGAGEGTKIVLMKRDDSDKPPSIYHQIFAGVAKVGSGRVARPPRRLRGDDQLTSIADAKNALLHSPDGRSLMLAAPNASIDELAGHLLEAAGSVTNKKDNTMQSFTKAIADLGEHGYTTLIQKFASNNKLPNETAAQAFVRIFSEDTPQGLAIRKCWLLSKGQSIADDPDDDADRDNEDDADAMAELEALAEAERKRTGMSKAVAFSKVYSANPELAAKERRQNRPRA